MVFMSKTMLEVDCFDFKPEMVSTRCQVATDLEAARWSIFLYTLLYWW